MQGQADLRNPPLSICKDYLMSNEFLHKESDIQRAESRH